MKNKFIDAYNHFTGKKGFDYDQITDEVYIGTNMCCQYGFDRELLESGVKADISLEDSRIDEPMGVDYFLWLPTPDTMPLTDYAFGLGIRALDFLIYHKIKVFIHCKNGHGRGPTLFIAYLMSKGMAFEQAFDTIRSKRPSIHLTDVQINALKIMKK